MRIREKKTRFSFLANSHASIKIENFIRCVSNFGMHAAGILCGSQTESDETFNEINKTSAKLNWNWVNTNETETETETKPHIIFIIIFIILM